MTTINTIPNVFSAALTAAWNGTGAEVANSSCDIALKNPNCADPASVGVGISGTFVGTVSFEVSPDGINFQPINGYPPNATAGATSATAPGAFQFGVAGMVAMRIRCSAFTSGTINVQANVSTASFSVQ